MTLDEKLQEIVTKRKGTIWVVDDKCDFQDDSISNTDFYLEHITNEDLVNSYIFRNNLEIRVEDPSRKLIQDNPCMFQRDLEGDSVILVSSQINQTTPSSLSKIIEKSKIISLIKEMSPNSLIYFLLPGLVSLNGEVTEDLNFRTITKVLSLISDLGEKTEFAAIDMIKYKTLMHYVAEKLTGSAFGINDINAKCIQHNYKNNVWTSKYLPLIDTSLRAGNSQTSLDYHFLILSDKEIENLGNYDINSQEKVKLRGLSYLLEQEDLEKCAAIFIDNTWLPTHDSSIGDGIKVLENLRKELDLKGVKIPIIYQSGHNTNFFTTAERQKIKGLGAILATKDLFPKVCVKSDVAKKEIEIGRILTKNPVLQKYTTEIYDFGNTSDLRRDDLWVVCSKITTSNERDLEKESMFNRLQINNDLISHKLYVLSNLHSCFKQEIENPILKETSTDFFDYTQIKQELAENNFNLSDFVSLQLYQKIVQESKNEQQLRQNNKTLVLTHNDAKWDNWFNQETLGDFGSCCFNTEYKDIAKSLLDPINNFCLTKDKTIVNEAINSYIKLRTEIDPSFNVENDKFRQNVYFAIVTECLRTAYYKADQKDLVPDLLEVAREYSSFI